VVGNYTHLRRRLRHPKVQGADLVFLVASVRVQFIETHERSRHNTMVHHRQGDDGAAKEVGVEVEEGGRHPRMLGQERRDAVLKPPRIQFHFCRLVRYFSA
jgi:hypothetical protein